jgi:hypothetical protein
VDVEEPAAVAIEPVGGARRRVADVARAELGVCEHERSFENVEDVDMLAVDVRGRPRLRTGHGHRQLVEERLRAFAGT